MPLELPHSKFLKVRCNDCGGEQVIFGCAASEINCTICGKTLAKPRGGKTNVLAKIIKILD